MELDTQMKLDAPPYQQQERGGAVTKWTIEET